MIDLHRHLGGSCRPETVLNILTRQKCRDYSLNDLCKSMTYQENDEKTFKNFLSKFAILDSIVWDQQSIQTLLEQVCHDANEENLKYVELKFTIDKYVRHTRLRDRDVIQLIYDIVEAEKSKYDIEIVLVLSLKYESDRQRQKEIANLVNDPTVADMLVGIDLVGDEKYMDIGFYEPIFNDWRKAGKGLQAHVGESQGALNVRYAIERLGVQRLAHGIRILEDKSLIPLAKERNICFDIALTSNYYTGVVKDIRTHPVLKLLEVGCDITIGTDDPAVFNTTLENEYRLLSSIGVDAQTIERVKENSAKYAFAEAI